jgi:flagellar biosynthetic protein FlhB
MMMTKQELREEMKDMDGDPHTRMRRREAHRKLTEGRNLQAVKTADVVITNPTELAIAIKYDPATMPAPTIVAKGADEIAAQIRKIAAEHGIPIIERKPLARALYKSVKVGQQIPAEMYDVFIEILAYVYRITGRQPPMGQ